MKHSLACAFLILLAAAAGAVAQEAAPKPTAKARQEAEKPAAAAAKTATPAATKEAEKDPLKAAFSGGLLGGPTDQPVTTEIFADEAFFDSQNHIGTFTGHVIVNDPRFNIQADKLTVHLARGEEQGLQKAIAEGNVGVVRDRPGEDGGPPVRSIGRAEKAVYTAADGNVELSGSPRVQSGLNTHVATSPETVMLINQSGVLKTRGPSRTEIRQEPKPAEPPKP